MKSSHLSHHTAANVSCDENLEDHSALSAISFLYHTCLSAPAASHGLPLSSACVLIAVVLWISVRMELRHTPLSRNNFRAGGSCARLGEVADGSHLLPEMCLTFCLGKQAVASNSLTLQAGSGFGSGLDLQACQAAGQSLWHTPVPGPEGGVWARLQLRECSPSRGVQDSGQVKCFRFFISPVGLRAPPSVGSVSTITSPCGHTVGEVEGGRWWVEASLQGQWGLHVCTWCLLLDSCHGLSPRCVWAVWGPGLPLLPAGCAALVQLCHCRHVLDGRCPHSVMRRPEVRQEAASRRACPHCSS